MENVSAVTSFLLTAYTELEDHRYLYFICLLIAYILVLVSNSVLIVVIYINRGLHEAMYFFICNLSANQIYGSTCFLPSILYYLSSTNYEISLAFCLLQIFCIHLYGTVEFLSLAVMSYDRYIAICHPLHYHLLMSNRKVCILISMSWMYPCIFFALFFMFTVQQTFCGRIIENTYCINFALVKLSCYDISIQSVVGLFLTVFILVPPLLMILFSYAKIFRICLFNSEKPQMKALQTCIPHLVAVINYGVQAFYEIIQSRFNVSHVPDKARILLSVFMLTLILMLNPLIYGISIQALRGQIYKLFFGKKLTSRKVIF